MSDRIADLAQTLGAAILVDRDVIEIGEAQACFTQAIGNRFRRKPCPMLDAAKPLLFGRRHQYAIPHQRRRGIAVKGIEAKDDYRRSPAGSASDDRSARRRRSAISSAIIASATTRCST